MHVKTERITDRMVTFILYSGMIIILMWFGTRLIYYTLDARFCYHVLINWESAIGAYRSTEPPFPVFSGTNHVVYMDSLIKKMMNAAIDIPRSNVTVPYMYQPYSFSPFKDLQNMFILCFTNRIIIYHMPERLFMRVDVFIDGIHDMNTGSFTGKPGKTKGTITGVFKI